MSGTTPERLTLDADGDHRREAPIVANANHDTILNTNKNVTSDTSSSTNVTNMIDVETPISTSVTTTPPLPSCTTTVSTEPMIPVQPPTATNESLPPTAGTTTIPTTPPPPQRVPYKYDPDKITLRFLFANRDGLTVTVTCNPSDTIGEVKGVLISIWPKDVPNCDDGDDLRLICMGKGFLSPDSRTLQDCQIPIFKTHPTPVNVSVKPSLNKSDPNSESSTNSKYNKRNPQPQTSNTSTNSNSTTANHHTNVNNNHNSSNNNTSGSHNHPRVTTTTTHRTSSANPNSPIETGQGCCIIS